MNGGSWCTCSDPLSPLPGLVSQSYLCIFTLCLPQNCICNRFSIKKDQLQTFAMVFKHSVLIFADPMGKIHTFDQVCRKRPHQIFRYFRKLDLHLLECTSARLNPAHPFRKKLPETRETPWLFSSTPQTSFCNLMRRENCCPQEKHTVLSWYSQLLCVVTFSSTKN